MWLYYGLLVVERPARWTGWVRAVADPGTFPRRGPAIVVANHSCFLDPWFVAAVVPRPVQNLITRKWYDRSRLWRFLFSGWGTIPVQDGDANATIDGILAALRRGNMVGIFPEGRISADGQMTSFRSGVAWMAARSGAPAIPIGIRGAYECLPRHVRFFTKVPRVRIHVGSPRYFPGAENGPVDPQRRDIVDFTRALEDEVRRLAGQPPREATERRRPALQTAD